ncbi:hypothetical protein ABZ912_05300 [Nonomuraea angiospora]|uniref:hypothetical protein n=1 Tax=Nonomuraea angiospora TaxID=46172 RepID=UPI0033F768FB
MIRLIAFLAILAVTSAASWVMYQDSKPGGVLVFIACMVVFVAAPYYRLMGLTITLKQDNDTPSDG